MADSHLDVLENRVELLENLVFGGANKDAIYPKGIKPFECVDTLVNAKNKIEQAVTSKKKIPKVFDKLPELGDYLDPAKSSELTLSEDAKAEIILAEEDFLVQQAARLETMQKLEDTLDSEHIRAVPGLAGKLQELSQIQIKQQDQTAGLTQEVRDLMATYNAIITLLSKQFVQWDETLTRLEMIANIKKEPRD